MLTAIASTDGATPGKIISAEPINKFFHSDFTLPHTWKILYHNRPPYDIIMFTHYYVNQFSEDDLNITILDGYSINPGDISWSPLKKFGSLTCYDRTADDEIYDRVHKTDAIFVSKCRIDKKLIDSCASLRFIGVTATGYDNVDLDAAKARGIAVFNTPDYSTEAVAQHTFALILELFNHVGDYNRSVHSGDWYQSKDFCYIRSPLALLSGRSLGIVGYGNIGKKVAEIGRAFGMTINVYSRAPEKTVKSDILTLHCPLTPENAGFIDAKFISGMKDGAILINTARGGLIDDLAVAEALDRGKLSAAAIDVLLQEPPVKPHPLVESPHCLLTPHIAWMPIEARKKVVEICRDNLDAFLSGGSKNRVV